MWILPSKRAYQLKITLNRSKPPIWRRLLVPGHCTLEELHELIQTAMGWTHSHLHQFIFKCEKVKPGPNMAADLLRGMIDFNAPRGLRYLSHPDFELDGAEDERRVRLDDLKLEEKSKFVYEYDFGDGWEHVILVEKISESDPPLDYPQCLAGQLACPPEDCGGMYGYYELLGILADPKHPEYEDYKDWAGDIDPEHFDLDEVNQMFEEMCRPKPKRKRKSRS